MPTVLWISGFRFFFVSFDCSEPMHIHIAKDKKECKYWCRTENDISQAYNKGFTQKEIKVIETYIVENFETIKQTWDAHCKDFGTKTYKKK